MNLVKVRRVHSKLGKEAGVADRVPAAREGHREARGQVVGGLAEGASQRVYSF